jgi:hypothetical protein
MALKRTIYTKPSVFFIRVCFGQVYSDEFEEQFLELVRRMYGLALFLFLSSIVYFPSVSLCFLMLLFFTI